MRFLLPPNRGCGAEVARAARLAEWLSDWLGEPCEVAVAPYYRELREAVLGATHDVVWAPPLVCGQVVNSVRSTPTAIRGGSTSSSAALIVRDAAEVYALSDLYGTRAAWVDRLSMGGYRSAVALLRRRGYEPTSMFRDQGFCGSYRDAMLAVAAGHAELTSVYAGINADGYEIRGTLEDMVGDPARLLRVLCRTPAAPYDALVITRRMSAAAAESFEQRVLELRRHSASNDANDTMLLAFCQSEGFSRLDESAYAWLEYGTLGYDFEPSVQRAVAH